MSEVHAIAQTRHNAAHKCGRLVGGDGRGSPANKGPYQIGATEAKLFTLIT